MTQQQPIFVRTSVQVAIPEGKAPGQYLKRLFDFVDHAHKGHREHDYGIITPDNRRVWKFCLKYGSDN